MLSEQAKKRRKRRNRLTNIINASSWLLEVVCQLLGMGILVAFGKDNLVLLNLINAFGFFYAFVLIPFTYLLNEKGMRQTIIDDGWIKAFKVAITFNRPRHPLRSNHQQPAMDPQQRTSNRTPPTGQGNLNSTAAHSLQTNNAASINTNKNTINVSENPNIANRERDANLGLKLTPHIHKNKHFRMFCRNKMLQKLLLSLTNDKGVPMNYHVLLENLYELEKLFGLERCDVNECILIALFNEWKLFWLRNKQGDCSSMDFDVIRYLRTNEQTHVTPTTENIDDAEVEKIELIKAMLSMLETEPRYIDFFKKVIALEQEQGIIDLNPALLHSSGDVMTHKNNKARGRKCSTVSKKRNVKECRKNILAKKLRRHTNKINNNKGQQIVGMKVKVAWGDTDEKKDKAKKCNKNKSFGANHRSGFVREFSTDHNSSVSI